MLPQAVKKLFDPQQIKHVGAMREKYFSTGDMREITGVRKEIKMGWQLSYTAGFGEISPDKPVVTDLAQRQRKNQSLIDVAKPYMRPQTVRRLSPDGTWENVPAASAAIGDTIQVRVGDRIPLDGIVRDGESLIDTSAITGEPVPVRYQPGDTVLSGGVNTTAVLTLCVTKELSESMVSKILQSVEEAAARKPHMDRFITRFARIYTPAVVAVAVATAVIPSMINGGNIRADLKKGTVTKGDIMRIFPFGSTVVTIHVSGADLQAALEQSVGAYPVLYGGFLQVSGISFSFDPAQPKGHRVSAILVGGQPLDTA